MLTVDTQQNLSIDSAAVCCRENIWQVSSEMKIYKNMQKFDVLFNTIVYDTTHHKLYWLYRLKEMVHAYHSLTCTSTTST